MWALLVAFSANPVMPGVPIRGEGYFPPTLSRQEGPLLGEGYFPPTLSCQEYPMLGEGCFPPNLYWPEYPWRGGHGEGNSCCCTVLIALVRWSKFGPGCFLGVVAGGGGVWVGCWWGRCKQQHCGRVQPQHQRQHQLQQRKQQQRLKQSLQQPQYQQQVRSLGLCCHDHTRQWHSVACSLCLLEKTQKTKKNTDTAHVVPVMS